jgi:hypothetical protein
MKQISLPAHHYAAAWKTEGVVKTLPEINDLGRRYAELPNGIGRKGSVPAGDKPVLSSIFDEGTWS